MGPKFLEVPYVDLDRPLSPARIESSELCARARLRERRLPVPYLGPYLHRDTRPPEPGDIILENDNTAPGDGASIWKNWTITPIRGRICLVYVSSSPKYFSPSPTPKFSSAAKSGSAPSGR